MTRRGTVILFATPAALMVAFLLTQWALEGTPLQLSTYQDIEIKALGNFPLDQASGKDEDIPVRFRKLDGRRVSLKGFMWPTGPGEPPGTPAVEQFQFIYALKRGNYQEPPLVQERVFATAPQKVPLYSPYEFLELRGVLNVGVERDETGAIRSVYQLKVESLAPIEDSTASTTTPVQPPYHLTKWDFLAATYLLLACLVAFTRCRQGWRQRRRLARWAAGLCPACGYDLRASIGRCSECGMPTRPRQSTAPP